MFLFQGVFITHGDVGVGTIVGSAVFNILCIIGVCGLFAGQVSGLVLSLAGQCPAVWGQAFLEMVRGAMEIPK
jgi:Ca2+/Na+ antiporter